MDRLPIIANYRPDPANRGQVWVVTCPWCGIDSRYPSDDRPRGRHWWPARCGHGVFSLWFPQRGNRRWPMPPPWIKP